MASGAGGADGGGWAPTIGSRIVSPAGVKSDVATSIVSTPHDHFAATPDCCVNVSARGRAGGVGRGPTVCCGVISPAGVNDGTGEFTTPHNHFATGPNRSVIGPDRGRVGAVGGGPTVRGGVISAARVHGAGGEALTPPDNHFTARPDCRV